MLGVQPGFGGFGVSGEFSRLECVPRGFGGFNLVLFPVCAFGV